MRGETDCWKSNFVDKGNAWGCWMFESALVAKGNTRGCWLWKNHSYRIAGLAEYVVVRNLLF